MKRLTICLALASGIMFGQRSVLTVTEPPPTGAQNLTLTNVGVAQNRFYCYWVVAVYPIGMSPSQGPTCTSLSNATLTSGNYNKIGWQIPPGASATGYWVVRGTSTTFPGSGTFAVNNSVLSGSTVTLNDQSNTLHTFNYTAIPVADGVISIDNQTQSTPIMNLAINGVNIGAFQNGSQSVSGNLTVGGNVAINGGTVNGSTNLTAPNTPVLSVVGTPGTSTCQYKIVANSLVGSTTPSSAAQVTTCPDTLGVSNYVTISTSAVTGSTSCDVYRTNDTGAPGDTGKIGNITCGGNLNDIGIASDNNTGLPTVNSTLGNEVLGNLKVVKGTILNADNTGFIQIGTPDWVAFNGNFIPDAALVHLTNVSSLSGGHGSATAGFSVEDYNVHLPYFSGYTVNIDANDNLDHDVVSGYTALPGNYSNTGTVGLVVGFDAQPYSNGGVNTEIAGFRSEINVGGNTPNVTTAAGVHVLTLNKFFGSPTIANNYGLKVEDQSGATANWAIKTGTGLVDLGDVLQIKPIAFASLPTCNGGAEGKITPINNSNTAVFNAAITTTGTSHVLAYCNGTAWVAH